MITNVNKKVAVVCVWDLEAPWPIPYGVHWQKRSYVFRDVLKHSSKMRRGTLYHQFLVSDGDITFKLELDTAKLSWTLLEISEDQI